MPQLHPSRIACSLAALLLASSLAASLLARDDDGGVQGPEAVGTLAVGPFAASLPLVQR